jgi:mannose-1-phosphate guanylyltransferase
MGSKTLLEETFARVSQVIPQSRTVTVLNAAHECFYDPLPEGISSNAVVQPLNRGTAPAILYALMRIADSASASAMAAVFPSDHYVADADAFARYVAAAFAVAECRPELTVLLGIAPDHPEPSYGWIEPGERVWGDFPVYGVRRFLEKPQPELASRLWRAGALWNSFVMVGRVSTLIATFMMALPRLYLSFKAVRSVLGTAFERSTIERVYADLASYNYSSQVLEKCAVNLAVMPVRGVGWSDLGEPGRVLEVWSRLGIRPCELA